MHDRFLTIPLLGGETSAVVNPNLIVGFFISDEGGNPVTTDHDDWGVAMMLSGVGERFFFVDFPSCEAARAYVLFHGDDNNRN